MRLDRVVAAAAPPFAREISGADELDDDPVHGSLGDSDRVADLTQADARIARDARQHLSVVRQERPW
jgi:hypothetical protein